MTDAVVLCMQTESEFAEQLKALTNELALWEGYLSTNKYLAGDEFTLADIAVAPWLLFYARQGATYKDFPKLAAYVETVKVSLCECNRVSR